MARGRPPEAREGGSCEENVLAMAATAATAAVSPPLSEVDSNFTHGKLERKSATKGKMEKGRRKKEENKKSPKMRLVWDRDIQQS